MTKGQEIAEWAMSGCGYDKHGLSEKIDAALTERTQECAAAANGAMPGYQYGTDMVFSRDKIILAILAVDKPNPPVWCEHIFQDGREWFLQKFQHYKDIVPNDWTKCPKCGKPRP